MTALAMTRRQMGALLVSMVAGAVWSNQPATLPSATDLPGDLVQALKAGQPLVVLVSLEGCGYCQQVRQNYLAPMRLRSGLHAVQIDMHTASRVADFDGKVLSHQEWVHKRGIRIAPTVLFFGAKGAELAPRLVGASLPDFYGAYLNDRLHAAATEIAKPY